jgi:hypothetical protein
VLAVVVLRPRPCCLCVDDDDDDETEGGVGNEVAIPRSVAIENGNDEEGRDFLQGTGGAFSEAGGGILLRVGNGGELEVFFQTNKDDLQFFLLLRENGALYAVLHLSSDV